MSQEPHSQRSTGPEVFHKLPSRDEDAMMKTMILDVIFQTFNAPWPMLRRCTVTLQSPIPGGGRYYYSSFTDEETETWRHQGRDPIARVPSGSRQGVGPGAT